MNKSKTNYRNEMISILKEIEYTYYNKHEVESIKSFIRDYSPEYYHRIKFEWNGKNGADFLDKNHKFRENVAIYYCLHCDNNNIELCKDIFVEETKCCKQSSGANEYLYMLGEKLLYIGKDKYMLQFLEGAFSSFDTYGCCLSIRLEKNLISYFIKVIDNYLEMLDDNELNTENC